MTVTEVYDKIRIGYKVEENVPTSYEIQNKMIELDDKIREKLSRYILHSEENNHFFVSFVYHTGSNGAEGSIKNSLLKVLLFLYILQLYIFYSWFLMYYCTHFVKINENADTIFPFSTKLLQILHL